MTADYRFHETIQRELMHRYAEPRLRLTISDIADGLEVDRMTVYGWWTHAHGASLKTTERLMHKFGDCDDYRGRIARRFNEIHNDHRRWKLERNMKTFSKLYTEVTQNPVSGGACAAGSIGSAFYSCKTTTPNR